MSARVSSPVLVGRGAEMGALSEAFARVRNGEPVVVVIGGEAGVGKSRLVSEFAEHAGREGAIVLAGGCIELAASGLPFAPVVEALRGLLLRLAPEERDALISGRRHDLARLLPELGTIQEPAPPNVVADRARARLFDAFLGLLGQLGDRGPVVVVVEDLHWADDSTRDLLAFVIHNLRTERALLCLTYRSDELHRRHPLKTWLPRYQREGLVERIELSPLEQEQTVEQVAGILGERPDDTLLELVSARSDGNPLFTEELVAASRANVESGLTTTLAELLVARVETLSETTQAVMRVASAAGRSVDHTLLAEVGGFPEDKLLDSLREAIEHHVLVVDPATGGYSFRHALVGEVVHEQLLPGERTRVHAAFARVLSSHAGMQRVPAPIPAELAHHWYHAHELPRALASSIEAGLAAEHAYAFPEALQHFERALEVWERVPGAGDLSALDLVSTQERASYAAYQAGDPVRAAALLESALESAAEKGDRVREGTLLYMLGRIQRWGLGKDELAIDTQRRAVDLLGRGEPSPAWARSLAELARGLALSGRFDKAKETAERALSVAKELEDPGAMCQAQGAMGTALVVRGDADGALPHILESLRLAERWGNPDDVGRSYVNLSDVLTRLGRFAEGADTALKGAAEMRRFGHEVTHGQILLCNACECYVFLGRWDEVERLMSEVLSSKSKRAGIEMMAATLRGTVRIRRGDSDRARRDVERSLRLSHSVSQPQLLVPMRRAMVELAILQARPDEASERAYESLEIAAHAGPWDGAHVYYLGLRSEADRAELARAHKDEAGLEEILTRGRALAERSESLLPPALPSGTIPEAGYGSLSRAELTRLEGASDPELWSDSVRVWQEIDCPYEVAYASWRLGEALLNARSSRQRAEEALQKSSGIATQLGAKPLVGEIEGLARRARIDLAPKEARARPSSEGRLGLTPRELEVLELVAAGMTNPQIAQELFISAKTAGIHVSHILAKLGVTGRVEAATLAQRLGLLGQEAAPSLESRGER